MNSDKRYRATLNPIFGTVSVHEAVAAGEDGNLVLLADRTKAFNFADKVTKEKWDAAARTPREAIALMLADYSDKVTAAGRTLATAVANLKFAVDESTGALEAILSATHPRPEDLALDLLTLLPTTLPDDEAQELATNLATTAMQHFAALAPITDNRCP